MKIELTTEQFKILLKMIYLANENISALGFSPEDNEAKAFFDLEDYIYGLCNEFDVKTGDEEFPEVLDEEIFDYENMDDMANDLERNYFFNYLVNMFALRELEKKYGKKNSEEDFNQLDNAEQDQFIEDLTKASKKYEQEFTENGIKNLYLKGF